MKNVPSLFLIIFGLMALHSSCDSGNASVLNSEVFDLSSYIVQLKNQKPRINQVKLISAEGDFRDTVEYQDYPMDSIANIILSFDFSRRERAGEFKIERTTSEGISCAEFRPAESSDIIYMTACQKDSTVTSLSGSKNKKSLLGVFQQSYHFDPEASFELITTYVDKIGSDTLMTLNYMYWE
jgi:hypothetical protein